MLNRRLLRVKVMQSLYAYFQSSNTEMGKAEKELFHSIDRVYDLYIHFLTLPAELVHIAEVQMEEARNKALPTDEDINPNRKFVDNPVINKLATNKYYCLRLSEGKFHGAKTMNLFGKFGKR